MSEQEKAGCTQENRPKRQLGCGKGKASIPPPDESLDAEIAALLLGESDDDDLDTERPKS